VDPAEPRDKLRSEGVGQFLHFLGFLDRNASGPLVITDIPLLAKRVQLSNKRIVAAQRLRQRLNGAKVVCLACDAISFGSQTRLCRLNRRMVGDRQSPIRA
jgi:hypothetical protein